MYTVPQLSEQHKEHVSHTATRGTRRYIVHTCTYMWRAGLIERANSCKTRLLYLILKSDTGVVYPLEEVSFRHVLRLQDQSLHQLSPVCAGHGSLHEEEQEWVRQSNMADYMDNKCQDYINTVTICLRPVHNIGYDARAKVALWHCDARRWYRNQLYSSTALWASTPYQCRAFMIRRCNVALARATWCWLKHCIVNRPLHCMFDTSSDKCRQLVLELQP